MQAISPPISNLETETYDVFFKFDGERMSLVGFERLRVDHCNLDHVWGRRPLKALSCYRVCVC